MRPSKWLVFIRPSLAGFDRPLTNLQVQDEDLDEVLMQFTNKGVQLRESIREIFGVPNRPLMDIEPEEMCALCMLFVSFEPD
jgi:hypothetical protein